MSFDSCARSWDFRTNRVPNTRAAEPGIAPRAARTLSRIAAMLVLAAAGWSCSSVAPRDTPGPVPDGKYDSEFPVQPTSRYLTRIAESVLRLNSVVYYRTYFFGDNERVTRAGLSAGILSAHEHDAVYNSNSTSGSATVLVSSGRQMALLTCAHLVQYPDTIFSFLPGPDRRPTPFLSSVSVQQREDLYIASLPEGGMLEVYAVDKERDAAMVGKTFDQFQPMVPQAIPYKFGNAAELEWGTFVYLLGYPAGTKIVTRAIVSSPNKDKQQSFLVDAVFGRGFSGGICLALRDGVPNFEMVGMIKNVPAHSSYVLTPGRETSPDELDLSRPYSGQSYVERQVEIEYGTSQALSAEAVRAFLIEHREELLRNNVNVDQLLHE